MADAKFRIAGNYDTDEASRRSSLASFSKGVTQQSGKNDADINIIVSRFLKTGLLPVNQAARPLPIDYTEIFDFRAAMEAVRAGEEAFAAMPAGIRTRFNNSAAQFVDFCLDPANMDEARKLGLALPKKEAVPVDNSEKAVVEAAKSTVTT